MRRFCRLTLSSRPLETLARQSMTTPVASASTWRWSSRRQERLLGPRYLNTCWRSRGSSNRLRKQLPLLFSFLRLDLSNSSNFCLFFLQRGGKFPHILLHICRPLPPRRAEDLQAARWDTSQVCDANNPIIRSSQCGNKFDCHNMNLQVHWQSALQSDARHCVKETI